MKVPSPDLGLARGDGVHQFLGLALEQRSDVAEVAPGAAGRAGGRGRGVGVTGWSLSAVPGGGHLDLRGREGGKERQREKSGSGDRGHGVPTLRLRITRA